MTHFYQFTWKLVIVGVVKLIEIDHGKKRESPLIVRDINDTTEWLKAMKVIDDANKAWNDEVFLLKKSTKSLMVRHLRELCCQADTKKLANLLQKYLWLLKRRFRLLQVTSATNKSSEKFSRVATPSNNESLHKPQFNYILRTVNVFVLQFISSLPTSSHVASTISIYVVVDSLRRLQKQIKMSPRAGTGAKGMRTWKWKDYWVTSSKQ